MVAVANLLPENPEDEASVLAVLREHPEARAFIQQASEKAQECFPGVRISLDAVQWEEGDPPLRLVLHIRQPWEDYSIAIKNFAGWLGGRSLADLETVGLLPLWQESHART
ncbi:MAG TPA: hypothetical protein VNP95_03245 [Thermomicrobiales bacterium]|nr:hypothetical protein [Thermomicrobiales bacterium]